MAQLSRKVTVHAKDKKAGMTAAEVRRVVMSVPADTPVEVAVSMRGRIRSMTLSVMADLPDLT